MLTIRKEQTAAFRSAMRRNFQDQMLEDLGKRFPADCQVLGKDQTRRVIDLGIDRAAAQGFGARRHVCDFITLMFILGSYFDEDPLLPWAAEALAGQAGGDPNARMARLYAKTTDYLKQVAGENGEHYRAVLLRARRMPFESIGTSNPPGSPLDPRAFLQALYPQRSGVLTDTGYQSLIALGRASAEKYGLSTREGFYVYIGLVFVLSSHFDRDPLHPWAAAILQDKSARDPGAKARRLHAAAMERLEQYQRISQSTARP
jgi:hypothetical protein